MDVRKNAADLTDAERDRFLEALILLDSTQAPGAPDGVTRYDQFVALHSVVMAVLPPGEDENPVNYAHWYIGFFPWHRQFVRDFEKALQEMVEGVTVPYWDWGDPEAVFSEVFTAEFLGSLHPAPRRELVDSVLRNPVPQAERPAWWPAGVSGYRIHPALTDELTGDALLRGTTQQASAVWRPTPELYAAIEDLVVEIEDVHPFWHVWKAIEEGATLRRTPTGGWVNVPLRLPTHNAGHNFVGGHMSNPRVSPNDPVFWLHHANVDRLWANWQAKRLEAAGPPPSKHYPPPEQDSPLGQPQPEGHRLEDRMWPWVGATPGYRLKLPDDDPRRPLLPDFSDRPAIRVIDVLDTQTIDKVGYRYAPPGG